MGNKVFISNNLEKRIVVIQDFFSDKLKIKISKADASRILGDIAGASNITMNVTVIPKKKNDFWEVRI